MREEKWYLGLTSSQTGEAFLSSRPPTRRSHSEYRKVVGPFTSIRDLRSYARAEQIQEQIHLSSRFPRRNPIELEGEEIYGDVLAIEARKGKRSLWPRENFRHDFTSKGTKVYGLKDGSLLIKGRKRLWKRFNY